MADELALLHGAATPKRKRPDEASDLPPEHSANPKFSFRSGDEEGSSIDTGCSSPRSKMAHQFRGLALESGGVVPASALPVSAPLATVATAALDVNNPNKNNDNGSNITTNATVFDQLDNFGFESANGINGSDLNDLAMRKRQKLPRSTAATVEDSAMVTNKEPSPSPTATPTPVVDIPNMAPTQATSRRPSLQRALPSINRLTTLKSLSTTPPEETDTALAPPSTNENHKSKSRGEANPSNTHSGACCRRTGIASADLTPDDSADEDAEDEAPVVDPLRASLTWHEDEITVYDPEDSEDDGEGIDGIGFKPSQPVAEARAAKRRQQLAEYRRREESEARDRRSRRRAAAAAAAAVSIPPIQTVSRMASGDDARKVRFREMESACALVSN